MARNEGDQVGATVIEDFEDGLVVELGNFYIDGSGDDDSCLDSINLPMDQMEKLVAWWTNGRR